MLPFGRLLRMLAAVLPVPRVMVCVPSSLPLLPQGFYLASVLLLHRPFRWVALIFPPLALVPRRLPLLTALRPSYRTLLLFRCRHWSTPRVAAMVAFLVLKVSLFFPGGGGGSPGHDIFVTYPDMLSKLCCGMVNGGVKFCTLGVDHCSYSTHSKKVQVLPHHVYIKAGSKAAFSHHKIPVSNFSVEQLQCLLGETRSLDEWATLFSTINEKPISKPLQSVATPARKRKQRYAVDEGDSEGLGSDLRELIDTLGFIRNETEEFEAIALPSIYLKFFEITISVLQKIVSHSDSLSFQVGEDMDQFADKLTSLFAITGSKSLPTDVDPDGLLSGPTLWEGLQALAGALVTNQQLSPTSSHQLQVLSLAVSNFSTFQTRVDALTGTTQQQLSSITRELRDTIEFVQLLNGTPYDSTRYRWFVSWFSLQWYLQWIPNAQLYSLSSFCLREILRTSAVGRILGCLRQHPFILFNPYGLVHASGSHLP